MASPAQIELYDPKTQPLDADNWRRRQSFFANAGRIAPLVQGNKPEQVCVLGPGAYAACTLTDGADICGLKRPVLGLVTVESGSVIVRDCDLAAGAVVQAGALAQFLGCWVNGTVAVAATGRVCANGGTFYGTGHIDNNGANPAASAVAIGNTRTSVTAHVNTTIIGEV